MPSLRGLLTGRTREPLFEERRVSRDNGSRMKACVRGKTDVLETDVEIPWDRQPDLDEELAAPLERSSTGTREEPAQPTPSTSPNPIGSSRATTRPMPNGSRRPAARGERACR